jgi:hypothetical protein
MRDFKPQWHHVYPSGFLEGHGVDEDKINCLANIAVIGPSINIRISAQDPMKYLDKYQITEEKLMQQFIEMPIDQLTIENYEKFVSMRASRLVMEANEFFSDLSKGLTNENVDVV